jgi:O-antigen/teichoic acid export membrane protein/glycosyltransferase involved in cell wall biosynthesis
MPGGATLWRCKLQPAQAIRFGAMTFSVVIAAYNAAATLGEAIDSVFAQTRQDFEVIVIDDGSSDGTAAVAAGFAVDERVRVYRQENAGPSAARNRGIAHAVGEYVSTLDSDDLWLPDYLAEMGRALEENPQAGWAYTEAWVLDEPSGLFRQAPSGVSQRHPPAPTLPREQFIAELLQRNFVHNSVTVRRAVLKQVGGYDPSLSHGEDYELWLRIAISGFEVVRVPGPLAIWRDRPGSLSHDHAALAAGLSAVYRTVLERHPASPRVRALAEARLEELRTSADRRARRDVRILLSIRGVLGAATRGLRERYLPSRVRLRSTPPQRVAEAFPGLGLGAVSPASPPRPSGPEAPRPEAELPGGAAAKPSEADPTRSAAEPPPASLTGVVTRGIRVSGAGYVVSQLLRFASYVVLAKLADPADFGHFAAGTVVMGVGALVGESGLLAALIQRREDLEEALNSAFLATLAGGLALTMLSLAVAPLVALFFHSHQAGIVAAVMSGWMLLRVTAVVPDALLQRRFSFMRRVIIDPLSMIAFAVGSIPAAAAGLGVWALVIGTYASGLVDVIAAWAFAGWRPRPRLASMAMWRELARFGRPVLGAGLIRRVVTEIPVLALGRARGPSALGQFTYAARVASQSLGGVINVGGYVLQPAFARLSSQDERFRAAVCRALRWLCMGAFPAGLLLVPLGTPAVVLLFGGQWREAGNGAAALGGWCAALSLDSIASEAWKSYGRTDMLARMHGLSLILTALCVGVLVHFGLVGVTIGMSVSAIGVGAYAVRGMSRALGIVLADLVSEIWPSALAAIAMAGSLFWLEHVVVHADHQGRVLGLALLALETLLGAAVYLSMLSVLAPRFTRELAGAVLRLVRRDDANRRSQRRGDST